MEKRELESGILRRVVELEWQRKEMLMVFLPEIYHIDSPVICDVCPLFLSLTQMSIFLGKVGHQFLHKDLQRDDDVID